jgi:hypothetical protein
MHAAIANKAIQTTTTPTGAVRKLLRVPVRGLLQAAATSARQLQASAGTESEFGLTFSLAPAPIPTATEETNQ